MKKIEWFWNMIYYNVYLVDVKMSWLFNFINPVFWFNRIPIIKRYYAKHGVDDMNNFANRILNNPKSGISSIWSGSFMGILLGLIEIGLLNIIETIIGRSVVKDVTDSSFHFIVFFVILMVPIILINNYLLFRKDKFLNYFEEFKMMSNEKKSAYGWLTFFVIILIFSFLVGSFLIFLMI
jgi:hypothetical protein